MERNYIPQNNEGTKYRIEREEIPYATGTKKVTTIRDGVIQEEERMFRLFKSNERITIE